MANPASAPPRACAQGWSSNATAQTCAAAALLGERTSKAQADPRPSLPLPQSPIELQDLLDATRALLDELEAAQRAAVETSAAAAGGGPAVPPSDPDTDELREKFRIMKVHMGCYKVVLHRWSYNGAADVAVVCCS